MSLSQNFMCAVTRELQGNYTDFLTKVEEIRILLKVEEEHRKLTMLLTKSKNE
jgi:hypothetical protein